MVQIHLFKGRKCLQKKFNRLVTRSVLSEFLLLWAPRVISLLKCPKEREGEGRDGQRREGETEEKKGGE